jgi:hypothetical protein
VRCTVLTELTAEIASFGRNLPTFLSNIRVDDFIVEKFTKAVYYLTLPSDVSSQFLVFFEYIAINGETSNTLF